MSITDELREWAKMLTHWWYDPAKDEYTYTTGTMLPSIDAVRLDSNIIAIADRIDAEHEKQLVEARAEGMQEGFAADKGPREFVELPKDADGAPIHVGDVMDGYGKTIKVVEMRNGRSGWVLISRDGNGYADTFAFTHHAPTVEDVLTEFGIDWEHESDCEDRAALLKEYAKRLTLAEGENA